MTAPWNMAGYRARTYTVPRRRGLHKQAGYQPFPISDRAGFVSPTHAGVVVDAVDLLNDRACFSCGYLACSCSCSCDGCGPRSYNFPVTVGIEHGQAGSATHADGFTLLWPPEMLST